MHTHFVFVSGGVVSGLGKGIIVSSVGKLLQMQGYSVTAIKIDPYINYDAGTMRPTEHGEVWVTEDGGEIDQDLGNYERFLDVALPKKNNITTGKVFWNVIKQERAGGYLGKTVQPIPHVTDEMKKQILEAADGKDFAIVEIGGNVGDYENILFFEAARQLGNKHPAVFIHVSYFPTPSHLGEMKTKPTQHSVKGLYSLGIFPDLIIGRSSRDIDDVRKEKISLFCNVPKKSVMSVKDIDNIYKVPLILEDQGVSRIILTKFGLEHHGETLKLLEWRNFIETISGLDKKIRIGIVGKYFDVGDFSLVDSYISVIDAIKHASWSNNRKPEIIWIDSKDFETDVNKLGVLKEVDCVIVPGGFGGSGIEGKILTVKYCRENDIPYLGLCLGLQIAVIEYARTVCGMIGANSTEFDPDTKSPVVCILPGQIEKMKKSQYGATMRLGGQSVKIIPGSKAEKLYGKDLVKERFRHRYEISPDYVKKLKEMGLIFSGMTPDGKIMQIIELPNHPFFMGSQFHPEFTSGPMKPNPLFDGLIKAATSKS